jgi:hypothetical protein
MEILPVEANLLQADRETETRGAKSRFSQFFKCASKALRNASVITHTSNMTAG